jgi:hypothetical protein
MQNQKYHFIVFGLTWPGLEPTIYHTRDEHANYNITDAVNSGLDSICVLYLKYA